MKLQYPFAVLGLLMASLFHYIPFSSIPETIEEPIIQETLTFKDDSYSFKISPDISASEEKVMACPAASNLATPYNSNNGQRGCMFDVAATNEVIIRCFDVNTYAGTTANYEIYYKAGSFIGSENNAGAWTLLGTATGITSAGNNQPTPIPITVDVTIPAGQTYGFYVTNDFGGGTSYTDGVTTTDFLASDGNITVTGGVGKSYPFGLTFVSRLFNGTIFYDPGGIPPCPTARAFVR